MKTPFSRLLLETDSSFEPREGLAFCRAKAVPSFLSYFKTLSIGPARESKPRPPALLSSALPTEIIMSRLIKSYFLSHLLFSSACYRDIKEILYSDIVKKGTIDILIVGSVKMACRISSSLFESQLLVLLSM